MISTNYFHVTDGRIRIHIPEARWSGVKAGEIAARLMEYEGIVHVSANPATGNVLIHHDPDRISPGGVFQKLRDSGYLRGGELTASSMRTNTSAHSVLGDTIIRVAVEALFLALTG